ncbi:hypothetical protein PTH_1587 [Pelotomaculum thermopropionicum SI]|uniref:Glycoside hydrolase family 57 N-terminal domain-containing protein n=1 Tax=Pelotomaculum thermopropionicum (strain DSM 13744 / JCM 10971 / SI) TaxID=370438 RepID=A5D1W3_PELTS|nr:hypothetical protein PTH_1587 [Pelotomaculum thermopropionicum SI]
MERYICVHGHFYQPPRENPWLEDVELQDSAYPYHDWNERITAECYEPNTASRILSEGGWIKKILNNYSKISFNFGPTLLSWMEKKVPEVYQAIIESDKESKQNFSGHGSAFAQCYNHMIMPLANRTDKYTQVVWGIKDFEKRFGRKPEGMWLPETAVDLETLDIMAEHGISFTVLAPYQASRFRRIGEEYWHEAGGRIDTTTPYLINLPESGRKIAVFFYNADISRAVAFERLLVNGERFAGRLLGGFAQRSEPQVVNIATDGETYGHHHRHGDMALAYALDYIESNRLARLTNYAQYLELHPPQFEVEIFENTAWSCAHGVERWRSNCGCNSGTMPGASQAWRTPLRNALDWLRDTVASKYDEKCRQYLKDPWAARNDYISVILDRSAESLWHFFEKHSTRILSPEERSCVLKLLELQRHAMLMYTSCGWFFDELSGIETVQIIKYAARVIQLAQDLFNDQNIESRFLVKLEQAKSNIPEHRDGARIYEKFVRPAMVDLIKVGVHYAICSLFDAYDDKSHIFCYEVHRKDCQSRLTGASRLTVGKAGVTSIITRESADLVYGVFNLGNHHVNAGVRFYQDEECYNKMVQEITGAFDRADYAGVIRLLDHYFGEATYSLRQLFRDKQRKVLDQILDTTLSGIAAEYRNIYERHAPLMRFLNDLNIPQPKVLHTAAEFVLNSNLRQAFLEETPDLEKITALLEEARTLGIPLDSRVLGYVIEQILARTGEQLKAKPDDLSLIRQLDAVVGLVRTLPFEVDLWKVQNIYYRLFQTVYRGYLEKAAKGDESARAWVDQFNSLGDKLKMRREL